MISDLKDSVIFLHGLSGSGKGEVHRKLAEKYSSEGYSVTYLSSGALFRAAFSDPVIAAQVRSGYFLDTLGAIMPGIKEAFRHFLGQWKESNGKSIIILDGLVRRGTYINKEGSQVPSQLRQIADGISEVVGQYLDEDVEDDVAGGLERMLAYAKHIVVNISPEDAEAQTVHRGLKEIDSIRVQLADKYSNGQIDDEKSQMIKNYIDKFETVLKSETQKEDQVSVAAEVKGTRENLAKNLGMEDSASIADSLREVGLFTELREDDVSPIGRKSRIDNYVKKTEDGQEVVYEAGFATKALEDLGFNFSSDGSFKSEAKNCIVLDNGKKRNVDLARFRENCELLASGLYRETEIGRELMSSNTESRIRFKER